MKAAPPQGGARGAGFTLVELVTVMVIVGVLAVAATTMFNRVTYDSRGYYDQAISVVSYAQKLAVAARRTVTVTLTASSISVTMCYDTGCTSTGAAPYPGGSSTFNARTGVSVAPATSFSFDALGRPSLGAPLVVTVTGDVARTFTVEQETGYVHP